MSVRLLWHFKRLVLIKKTCLIVEDTVTLEAETYTKAYREEHEEATPVSHQETPGGSDMGTTD